MAYAICMVAQTVSIDKVWIEYDVYHNSQKGMKIYCNFTVHDYKNQNCNMSVVHRIEHADGRELWGNTPGYYSIGKHGNTQVTAVCGFDITPGWEHTIFNDWWVFMPYSALHIYNGKRDLRVATSAWDKTHDNWCADKIVYTPFWYDSGNSNPPGSSSSPVYVTPASPVVPQVQQCGVCHGTGRCSICGGSGISPNHAPGIIAKCGGCGGTGLCPTCSGRGSY